MQSAKNCEDFGVRNFSHGNGRHCAAWAMSRMQNRCLRRRWLKRQAYGATFPTMPEGRLAVILGKVSVEPLADDFAPVQYLFPVLVRMDCSA